jgi:DNA-binding NarL/FixJ family response regulator
MPELASSRIIRVTATVEQRENQMFIVLDMRPILEAIGHPLTARQVEVLRLVRMGKSNKEIGSFLNITERTVKFHVRDIMNMLEKRKRGEL